MEENEIPRPYVRIGYHRMSDDCVTSMAVAERVVYETVAELVNDADIDHVWIRDDMGNVLWEAAR